MGFDDRAPTFPICPDLLDYLVIRDVEVKLADPNAELCEDIAFNFFAQVDFRDIPVEVADGDPGSRKRCVSYPLWA